MDQANLVIARRPEGQTVVGGGRSGLDSVRLVEALEQRIVLDSTVVFNEIMYNPAGIGAASDNLEWIELHNQMAVDMDLSGWRLDNGIDFKIPEGIHPQGRQGTWSSRPIPRLCRRPAGFTGALGRSPLTCPTPARRSS